MQTIFEGSPVLDGRYRLIRRLGGGGGGSVYRSRHLGLKRLVAVKILRPQLATEPRFVARFRREAEALGRLRHPHIVEVTDFGVDAERGFPFLVMEHLEGETLGERLRARGPLELDDALAIFDQIAAGVDHAHAAGVLHRDLKPSNVFLTPDGGITLRVKVLDFGLARFVASPEETPLLPVPRRRVVTPADLTDHDNVVGTPGYQAPEVLMKRPPTAAADVYAFGVLMDRSLRSERLAPALAKVLAGNPAERPSSARHAVEILRRAARRGRRRRRREHPRRRLAWTAVVGLATAFLAALSKRLFGGPRAR